MKKEVSGELLRDRIIDVIGDTDFNWLKANASDDEIVDAVKTVYAWHHQNNEFELFLTWMLSEIKYPDGKKDFQTLAEAISFLEELGKIYHGKLKTSSDFVELIDDLSDRLQEVKNVIDSDESNGHWTTELKALAKNRVSDPCRRALKNKVKSRMKKESDSYLARQKAVRKAAIGK